LFAYVWVTENTIRSVETGECEFGSNVLECESFVVDSLVGLDLTYALGIIILAV